MIFPWFPCYKYGICIYPRWTVLKIHLPPKVWICIPGRVMPNRILVLCHRSVVLHLNLSKIRARGYKIWFGQSSSHSHWHCICLISRMQNKHVAFMTIHCNAERCGGTTTSKPDVMVVHIKLLSNLSISQKTSLRSLYIDTCLWPKSMPQSKGCILVKVCQGATNTCSLWYPTPITKPTTFTNIRYPQTLLILHEASYAFNNIFQSLHGYWFARLRLSVWQHRPFFPINAPYKETLRWGLVLCRAQQLVLHGGDTIVTHVEPELLYLRMLDQSVSSTLNIRFYKCLEVKNLLDHMGDDGNVLQIHVRLHQQWIEGHLKLAQRMGPSLGRSTQTQTL